MTTRRWSFLIPLAAFTTSCALGLWLVLLATGSMMIVHYLGILLYFAVVTGILHAWQEHAIETNPKGFVHRFMIALVGKMFLSVVVLVVLLFTVPQAVSIPLALSFAVLYLLYLIFSTVRLVRLSQTGKV